MKTVTQLFIKSILFFLFFILYLLISNKTDAYICYNATCPSGTQSAGTLYDVECSPNCTDPWKICWSSFDCGPVINCSTYSDPNYCSSQPLSCPASCGGGQVLCSSGGNCVSACYGCCSSNNGQLCGQNACGAGSYDCDDNCNNVPSVPEDLGQSCGQNACGSGTVTCGGNCTGAPSVPGNYGQSCGQNSCGSGTIDCSGNCSGVPSVPGNYGWGCGWNACGGGSIDCSGQCNNIPNVPGNYGQSCGTNSCGSGTIGCDGQCNNIPNVPSNYGQSCGTNSCGSGTIGCDGQCHNVPTVPNNFGDACNTNICGSGKIDCSGQCKNVPNVPGNYGESCGQNECGQGSIGCSGGCEGVPVVPGNWGTSCGANVCGAGSIGCDSNCGAIPVVPPNYGTACNQDSCGGGSGTIQCNSACSQPRRYCIAGNVCDDNNYLPNNSCSTNAVGQTIVIPGGGTTTTNTSGNYSITGLSAGSYTVTVNGVPANAYIPENPASGSQSQTVSGASDATNTNFIIRNFYINGTVFFDANKNGVKDSGEDLPGNMPVFTVSLSGGITSKSPVTITPSSNPSGSFVFNDVFGGASYTVTVNMPIGYLPTTANPRSNTLGPDWQNVNFGIAPQYEVTGNVFVDIDKNLVRNGSEGNYSGPITIGISPSTGNITYPSAGAYKIANLLPGTYTVEYTSVPTGSGYVATYPVGSPPSYQITLGDPSTFSPSTTPDGRPVNALGDNDGIQNLNFGISNSNPWGQCHNGDCRVDSGYSVSIPSTATPACGGAYASIAQGTTSTTPGLVFSGNGTKNFGNGQASSTNWIAGGYGTDNYDEVFRPANPNVIRSSYDSFVASARQSGITITDSAYDISPQCAGGIGNCTLSASIPNGIYHANGNLILTAASYTFPTRKNYVILVNGDLRINGKILVPNGSSVTFSVVGSISVDKTVGSATPSTICTVPTTLDSVSTGCDVEGFYTTNENFIVEGINNCSTGTDKRFNLAGSIVANATLLNTGTFQNQRDMCTDNLSCPVYSFVERPDFILNAPQFIKRPSYIWQEVAP